MKHTKDMTIDEVVAGARRRSLDTDKLGPETIEVLDLIESLGKAAKAMVEREVRTDEAPREYAKGVSDACADVADWVESATAGSMFGSHSWSLRRGLAKAIRSGWDELLDEKVLLRIQRHQDDFYKKNRSDKTFRERLKFVIDAEARRVGEDAIGAFCREGWFDAVRFMRWIDGATGAELFPNGGPDHQSTNRTDNSIQNERLATLEHRFTFDSGDCVACGAPSFRAIGVCPGKKNQNGPETCCWDRIEYVGGADEDGPDPSDPSTCYVCTIPKGVTHDVHEHREDFGVLARWIMQDGERRFVDVILVKTSHDRAWDEAIARCLTVCKNIEEQLANQTNKRETNPAYWERNGAQQCIDAIKDLTRETQSETDKS